MIFIILLLTHKSYRIFSNSSFIDPGFNKGIDILRCNMNVPDVKKIEYLLTKGDKDSDVLGLLSVDILRRPLGHGGRTFNASTALVAPSGVSSGSSPGTLKLVSFSVPLLDRADGFGMSFRSGRTILSEGEQNGREVTNSLYHLQSWKYIFRCLEEAHQRKGVSEDSTNSALNQH